jgi:hypothetical protein
VAGQENDQENGQEGGHENAGSAAVKSKLRLQKSHSASGAAAVAATFARQMRREDFLFRFCCSAVDFAGLPHACREGETNHRHVVKPESCSNCHDLIDRP